MPPIPPAPAAASAAPPVAGRPAEVQLRVQWTAWLASLIVHLAAVAALAAASWALPHQDRLISLALESLDLTDPEPLAPEFVSSDQWEEQMGALAADQSGAALALANEWSERIVVTQAADLLPVLADRPLRPLDLDRAAAPSLA
ncbi:MAG TPA: hypothetical protein PKC18_17530, partial [Lacipirellulaceae bacterium]|nr:hypothetical protein [Lacipirellulaceae bacterium]